MIEKTYTSSHCEKHLTRSQEKSRFDEAIKQSFLAGSPAFNNTIYSNTSDYCGLNQKNETDPHYFMDREKVWGRVGDSIQKEVRYGKCNEHDSGKFFSVASSCRFAVASFSELINDKLEKVKSIGGIHIKSLQFEKRCKVKNVRGAAPQLDVYFETDDNTHYFFEVKCHEIFDTSNHSTVELSTAYLGVMKELLGIDANANKWETKGGKIIGKDSKPLSPEDFGLPESKHHFDFKQFLCHLMGILSSEQYKNGQHINFFYLFYKAGHCPEVYEELEAEMENIANRFSKILGDKITFGCIYNTKFDTLTSITPYRIFNEQK